MPRLTKVSALINLLRDNGGAASWKDIYDNIEGYYPNIKAPKDWEAALRGVLYREFKNRRHFKRISPGVFALADYQEQEAVKSIRKDKVRMHSYIEGLLVEAGNYENYDTYCADKKAVFQANVRIGQLASMDDFPDFTYEDLVQVTRRIDVVWFNKRGYKFPQRAIEVVDSINTLEPSLSRMYQLRDFQTNFLIAAPKEFSDRINRKLRQAPYSDAYDRFEVRYYDDVIAYHQSILEVDRLRF